MWKIGNVEIKNQIVLAPMAGISNTSYRKIIKKMGAGLIYAEMVSDKAISHNNEKTLELLKMSEEERPIAQQIFGSDVDSFVTAAKIIENVIKLDSNCAEAYRYKSMIYEAQGLKNRSIENAKIAVSLQPSNHSYYAFLAKLYFNAQEYENAFLYYKEASMLDELNVDYLYNAAVAADKANDFNNAANYYSYALRLEPFNNLIIYEYVDLLKRNNKIKQALNLLKNKINTVESNNVAKLLKQKYNELLEESKKPILQKIKDLITKKK